MAELRRPGCFFFFLVFFNSLSILVDSTNTVQYTEYRVNSTYVVGRYIYFCYGDGLRLLTGASGINPSAGSEVGRILPL